MYEEIIIEDGTLYIKKTDGDTVSWIPANDSNVEYQQYLVWKQENS